METYLKHKVAITILSVLTLVFASLFGAFYLELNKISNNEGVNYLKQEEAVVIIRAQDFNLDGDKEPALLNEIEIILPIKPTLFEYIEVFDSCGPYFEGDCLNVRSGPGTDFPIVNRLRNGTVLKVGGKVERDGITWYKIVFDEWIRYPERVRGDMYIVSDYVEVLLDEGVKDGLKKEFPTTSKKIVVSRSKQTLRAFEGEDTFMEIDISTGLELTPTPRGTFTIFRKTPTRYMQGPLPGISSKYWDLPGVPWNLYFTHEGAVIHGAYWHNNFGERSSNGCVNVRTDEAEKLYKWADIGTKVIVQD